MQVETKDVGGVCVVSVVGRMDAGTAPDFEKTVTEKIEGGAVDLVIDLGGLDYISSAGLRAILSTGKKVKAKNGRMFLAAIRGAVKDVFDISGFGSVFQIYDTKDMALAQF